MEDEAELEVIVGDGEGEGGTELRELHLNAKGASLSPMLELLRSNGVTASSTSMEAMEMGDAGMEEMGDGMEGFVRDDAEDHGSTFLVEPMSLPAHFSASDASTLLQRAGDASSLGIVRMSGGAPQRRPSSQPPESEGPMTWPHSAAPALQFSTMPPQPGDSIVSPTSSAGTHRRLFALPRLPGSLSSIDDGQVAEEDSVEFRENLNKLSAECVEKLEAMSSVGQLAEELAAATMALAEVEQRFVQPPSIHPADEAPGTLQSSASAIETLGNIMHFSAQSRESFAERLRSLNEATELANSLAVDAADAAADHGGTSQADASAAGVVAQLRLNSQAPTANSPGKQRRPSFSTTSSRERKRSVWREVAKKVPVGGGDAYKKRVLKDLDDLALAVEKATSEYEDALAVKLNFALDGNATESSQDAAVCRERKKALDTLRIRYVDALERVHAQKEAEILDRVADTFFAQRESVAAMLATMDRAAPRFEAMRRTAEAAREEAVEMADRRRRMGQAVEAKAVKRLDIRDLRKKEPGHATRKRAQTLAAGSGSPPPLLPLASSTSAEIAKRQHPKLGELPPIPSQDLSAENEQDAKNALATPVGGDPVFAAKSDGDASPPDSAQLKQLMMMRSGDESPLAQPPASPVVRRESVIFAKAGFMFSDSPELATKVSAVAALATPRVRERKRWVRAWCALDGEGKLKMQRLPAPSSSSSAGASTPPKGSSGEKCLTIDLARCEVVEPKHEELPAGMYDGAVVMYRAVRKCTVRSGKSLSSTEVGTIEIGEEVRAIKHSHNLDGQLRVQCSKGWASVCAKDGCPLLARQGRPWIMQLRRMPTAQQSADAAAAAAAAASAPSAEEGVPPIGVSATDISISSGGGSPEKNGTEAAAVESPSPPTTASPVATAVLESVLLLSVQAESAEEFAAWRDVLTEAAAISTARKKAHLTSSVKSWLSTIPIGGDGQRQYDPADLLDFAWNSGLENESPETVYMLFVEHQQSEGLRQEEQEQQEMLMLRRARMSECGVVKLRHPHTMPDEDGGVGPSRSRLATEPIWVAGTTVGLPGKIQPKGRASVQLAEYKEASRDFTRTLLATTQDILLLSLTTAAAAAAGTSPGGKDMEQQVAITAGPLDDDTAVALGELTLQPVACETKGTGDVNEEIISKVEAEFIDVARHCIAQAFGAKGNFEGATDVELARRLVGHLTVTPGMEVLTSNEVLPAMFQNKFVIVSGAGQIRLATYGFIGGPAVGDRPDRKSTPYAMRMLSSNLADGFGRGESVEYAVRRTTMHSIREFITEDVRRWGRVAMVQGDYSGFLKTGRAPPSRALAARRLVRKEELEELRRQEALKRPQKRKGMYRLLKKAVVRDKSTTDSKKLGVLGVGQRIKVVSSRERDGVERCKVVLPPEIKGERGWVSLVAKDGTVLMVEEQEWAPSGTDDINREWVECETL